MSRYAVIITVDDKEENFTKEEIEEMIKENMLVHVDNAPILFEKLEIKRLF